MQERQQLLSFSSSIATARDYWELTKPGITLMVLVSMLIGFMMGSSVAGFDFLLLIHVTIGTFLTAAGTSAYNQYIERDLDKLMKRTSSRPLPMQRISTFNAQAFSFIMIVGGVLYLLFNVHPLASVVSGITSIIYLGFYTPLKRLSWLNVLVGAIPGALPPVGGWVAATGTLVDPGMWVLFGIQFMWQVPHVIAIAWLCNEDYTNAGFSMLPKNDLKGFLSTGFSLICTVSLIPIPYLLYSLGLNSVVLAVLGGIAGLGFTAYSLQLLLKRDHGSARKLLFASLFYLPIIWVATFIDHILMF